MTTEVDAVQLCIHLSISLPAANIDREDQDRHTFNVIVRGGGGGSQTVTCTVQVLDENDNSPTFQAGSYYSRNVQEDLAVSGRGLACNWGCPCH